MAVRICCLRWCFVNVVSRMGGRLRKCMRERPGFRRTRLGHRRSLASCSSRARSRRLSQFFCPPRTDQKSSQVHKRFPAWCPPNPLLPSAAKALLRPNAYLNYQKPLSPSKQFSNKSRERPKSGTDIALSQLASRELPARSIQPATETCVNFSGPDSVTTFPHSASCAIHSPRSTSGRIRLQHGRNQYRPDRYDGQSRSPPSPHGSKRRSGIRCAIGRCPRIGIPCRLGTEARFHHGLQRILWHSRYHHCGTHLVDRCRCTTG